MFRLFFLTFFGQPRFDEHKVHVHESPKNMLVPLVVLAVLSVVGGWWAAPHSMGGVELFRPFSISCVFAGTRIPRRGHSNASWLRSAAEMLP